MRQATAKRRKAFHQPTTEQVQRLDTSLHAPANIPLATKTPPKLAVTPKMAAEMLCMGYRQLYDLLMTGEIASYTVGRSRRIPVIALETFIRERLDASA